MSWFEDPEDVVLYWLGQLADEERPASVVKATCELYWPDRTFVLAKGEASDDEEEMCMLRDFVDADTAENAHDLLIAEYGLTLEQAPRGTGPWLWKWPERPDDTPNEAEPVVVGDC
jgi:hypothetical protein